MVHGCLERRVRGTSWKLNEWKPGLEIIRSIKCVSVSIQLPKHVSFAINTNELHLFELHEHHIAISTICQEFLLPVYTKFIRVYIWCTWTRHRRMIISPSVLTLLLLLHHLCHELLRIEPVQHASSWCA